MKAKYLNPFTDFGFKKIFGEEAELAKFGQADIINYENSLKIYRDLKNVIDTAFDEGKVEGKLETAKSLKKLGVPIETILEATGLTEKEIESL